MVSYLILFFFIYVNFIGFSRIHRFFLKKNRFQIILSSIDTKNSICQQLELQLIGIVLMHFHDVIKTFFLLFINYFKFFAHCQRQQQSQKDLFDIESIKNLFKKFYASGIYKMLNCKKLTFCFCFQYRSDWNGIAMLVVCRTTLILSNEVIDVMAQPSRNLNFVS